MPPVVAEVIGIVEGCDAAIHRSAYTNIAGGIGLTAGVPFRVGNCVALAAGIELEEVIVWNGMTAWMRSCSNLLMRGRIRRRVYRSRDEARQDAFDYIEMFYNPKRKHVRNGMLSPA